MRGEPHPSLVARFSHAASAELARLAPFRPDLHETLDVYLNEVHVALDLVNEALSGMGREGRVLEVGGGIEAVSACLAYLGDEVVATEPDGPGFGDMLLLQAAIDGALAGMPKPSGLGIVLPIGVEELDPNVHGRFPVVFSANVLEHVDDPALALDRMQAVLADGGCRLTCARTTPSPTSRTSLSRCCRSGPLRPGGCCPV